MKGQFKIRFAVLLAFAVQIVPASAMKVVSCKQEDELCEFRLVVEQRLTMMAGRTAMFPFDGKLYRYDVTNTSAAAAVGVDDVITGDGWEAQRLVVVANGSLPGPALEVWEGQTVLVHVTNHMPAQALSIHWHGLDQRGTPWMDGVAHVTQCPVLPGNSFSYAFTAEPAGTFWYHSHVAGQLSDGMVGALVVRPRPTEAESKQNKGPDGEDGEHVVMIQEWNHVYTGGMVQQRMAWGAYDFRQKQKPSRSWEGAYYSLYPFNSALINGRGRYYFANGTHNGAPLTEFSVEKGKKYRLRLIGSSSLYPFRVSVDGHLLTIVASDGYPLEPVTAESVVVNPGERYDVIIAADGPEAAYWVRAVTLEVDVQHHQADAILRYAGSGGEEPSTSRRPCTDNDKCVVVNCPWRHFPLDQHLTCLSNHQLRHRHDSHTPARPRDKLATGLRDLARNEKKIDGKDDKEAKEEEEEIEEIFLNFGFPGITETPGSINGRAFVLPAVPPLTQPGEADLSCPAPRCGNDTVCHCSHTITLKHNKVYQFVLTNMGKGRGWAHPSHMHGHHFHLLKTGYPPYNETTGQLLGPDNADIECGGEGSFCTRARWRDASWGGNNVPGLELNRPPVKDTVQLPTGGYVVLRIRADNPGLWFLHCHVTLHLADGMAVMLDEAPHQQPPPPPGFPRCGHFTLTQEELLAAKRKQGPGTWDSIMTQDKHKPHSSSSDKQLHRLKLERFDSMLLPYASLFQQQSARLATRSRPRR